MTSVTAVELGADICALASTDVRGGDVRLLAAETLDPAAFPGIDTFTAAVREARKSLNLPKRCRAVVWGLPDGAHRKDPMARPLIAPLRGAGFRVDRVISPCNALAALARLRTPRGDGATCWLAVNRTGVAMVVVRPGEQLYSHSFAWDSSVGSSGSQARLLQRYSLVAFLEPEIRRAMAVARQKGTPVDTIITCGNLPEIRSLTMPLIEELDVEVETLDSLEGLAVGPDASDRLLDVAASLRLACAGAIARPTRRRDESKGKGLSGTSRSVLRFGAAAAMILAVLAVGWAWWTDPPVTRKPAPVARTPAPITQKPAPVAQKPAAVTQKPDAVVQKPAAVAQKPAAVAQKPAPTQEPAPPGAQKATPPPAQHPTPPAPTGVASVSTPSAMDTQAPAAVKPVAEHARSKPAPSDARNSAEATPMPDLLKDPVPHVSAILVASDRRMATLDDGRIVTIGDVLGKRVVVGIDERAVTLREPSGVQIRVALGGKVVGIERSER